MKRGSKEFYELMDQFERDIKSMPVYIGGKVEREERAGRSFYTNGNVNNMFIAYMYGYQSAKSLARMDALETKE